MCYRKSTLMRDSLTSPATAPFTLREPNAAEGPPARPSTPDSGQSQTSRPCNIMLHPPAGRGRSRPVFSLLPCLSASLHPAPFDRYTCRTKNAVSSSTSSKLPNLIDTKCNPAAKGRLHLGSSCRTTRFETLPISNLQLPPSRACNIMLRSSAKRRILPSPPAMLRGVTYLRSRPKYLGTGAERSSS